MSSSPHENHDLREVPPGAHYFGVAMADFDPTQDEPDLDIWPLPGDTGAEDFDPDADELIPIYNTFPEPHVRWLTSEQFEYQYGYPPDNPAAVVRDDVLEEIRRENRLKLTGERLKAFRRIARLWNGEYVGPHDVHLLADKIPSWDDVFGDLDQHHLEDLRPTIRRHDEELIDAFGEFSWFEPEIKEKSWLKSTHIARVRADYDIEEKARTLINGRDDLPALRGDPHEGLKHRFGVGCEAARAAFSENRDVETYVQVGDYVVDLLERDQNGAGIVGEVLTDHNNNRLYRATYEKIVDLQAPTVLVFDTRETARRVLNHWHDRCGDVPGAPFGSAPNIGWLREQFVNAARDSTTEWPVRELFTLSQLWEEVFTKQPAPTSRKLMSEEW